MIAEVRFYLEVVLYVQTRIHQPLPYISHVLIISSNTTIEVLDNVQSCQL